jgi:hypothetical protein
MTVLAIILAAALLIALYFVIVRFFQRTGSNTRQDSEISTSGQSGKYRSDPRAVVISCYFNPQNNPYRLKNFNRFYDRIKHLDHRIIECVIGDAQAELPENANIKRVYAKNLLWHKESLLNRLIAELPPQYEYVFWVDADVIFENDDWLAEGVRELETYKIIQPFEYGVHLDRDQTSFSQNPADINRQMKERIVAGERLENIRVWQSFCATLRKNPGRIIDHYDLHGHVGFAWGARREVLRKVPLYDKALIGGADHIIAHAAAGQIPHQCITRAFAEDLDEVLEWSRSFYRVGFVPGTLLHLWHGELAKRDYLKRIQVNTAKIKEIKQKDRNGLYETDDDSFVHQYFETREVRSDDYSTFDNDYSGMTETRDYFQSETVDFAGGGAGGDWSEPSGNSEALQTAGAEASLLGAGEQSLTGSTFS